MIDYDKALKTAKSLKQGIDTCDEYDNAFVFKSKADKWNIGGAGACCVLKEDGRAINMLEYVDNYSGKHIREFNVE